MAVVLADWPPDLLTLVLEGESDAYDAERLRTTIAALPRTTVPLVIDLSRATFIDSTVAGVLLEQTRAAATEGRTFAVFLPDTAGPTCAE